MTKPVYVLQLTENGLAELGKTITEKDERIAELEKQIAGQGWRECNTDLIEAKEAMERAKAVPMWDNLPRALHRELDAVFRALNRA